MRRGYLHILMALHIAIYVMVGIFFPLLFSQHVFGKEAGKNKALDLEHGKRIYTISCVLCHGSKGKGDGPASIFIGPYSHPRPNDFTRGVFKYRTTETGDLPTLSDLMRTISYGIPGYMPSFKHLGEEGVLQVALYISSQFVEDPLSLEPMDGLNYGETPSVMEKQAVTEKQKEALDHAKSKLSESGRVQIYKQIAGILKNISQNALTAIAQKEDPELALARYRQIISLLNRIVAHLEARPGPSIIAQKPEQYLTPAPEGATIQRYMNPGNAGISLEKAPASPSLPAPKKLKTAIAPQNTVLSHRLKSGDRAASLSPFSELYIGEGSLVLN